MPLLGGALYACACTREEIDERTRQRAEAGDPTPGYDGAPSRSEAARRFQRILTDAYQVPSTVRLRRGIDIAAGCGQLAS